ncbi:MAG: apolipoprotein N-acyltransferase [Bacteroidales bacterium]|nr:apolipoprotein N-acyltransferase [Bacteroidales bacterium]
MSKDKRLIALLLAAFSVLISLPWLVPHCGVLALVALVPLLCAERLATGLGLKRFFWWYYAAFVAFNALTTWWVCKATVGGGIFAVLANALQMAVIFGLFRVSRRRFDGALPYIFLAAMWIAWERFYLVDASISWPWLAFGNAFARSTRLIQWYEWTGMLGGSLWVWVVNLGLFGLMVVLSNGWWMRWTPKARWAAGLGLALVLAGPMVTSAVIFKHCEERSDAGTLDVVMAQSNFDPWQKLRAVPQREQNAQVTGLFEQELCSRENPSEMALMVLPETFTSDIWIGNLEYSPTWRTFSEMVRKYPDVNLLFGASAHQAFYTAARPNVLARKTRDDVWYVSYNSAFMTDSTGREDRVDKSKLVVGTELTPWPKIMVPFDEWLGRLLGSPGGFMGRCVIQGEARNLEAREYGPDGEVVRRVPIGVPICYESIYPEWCRDYVREGATLISVITNDGWWGNTPGYRQHFSYSRLRAIELRRDIARCANTGISAFIDQRGEVVRQSGWWVPYLLHGRVNLTEHQTFFARYGDIVGRLCTFVFVLMLLALLVRLFIRKK